MTLRTGEGTKLEVVARGEDAEALLDEIERIVASGFGEELGS